MFDFSLLQRLCTCRGISGDESAVRDIIINEISGFADSIETDALGNLIVFKKGAHRAEKKLMLSAHMDEVGLMVTDVTEDGYLKFDEVGGLDKRVLPGKYVTVGSSGIKGVIGLKPIHLCSGDERSAVPKMCDMYIDIGALSREDALKAVKIGDSICFDSEFKMSGGFITSKAIDDRFGCCVLVSIIKSNPEYDMYFVFDVQEEVGLRGAQTAAYSVDPEFAIVVETTTAADLPETEPNRKVCMLGEGAVISVMDRRTIYDKALIDAAFDAAKQTGAKAQYKLAVCGGNDAGVICKSRGGVRTLAVSLPCRYLHSPVTAARADDCEDVLKIVSKLASEIAGGKSD